MDDVYRSLFRHAPDAQIVVDENGIIERANLRAEQIFGYAATDLVGHEIEMLVPEHLREIHRRHRSGEFVAEAVGCTRPVVSGLTRDHVELPLSINLSSIATPEGSKILASVRDIDSWAEALDTHAAFDHAPVAMALVSLTDDGDRVIRSGNHALAVLVGVEREELPGTSFRDLTHPDDRTASEQGASEIVAGRRRSYEDRKRYRHSSGDYVWVDIHTSLVASPGNDRLALVHVLDIGDRVALEHQQRVRAEALEAEVVARTTAHVESERRLRLSLGAERHLLIESQDQQRRLDVSLRAAGMGTFEWDVPTNRITYDARAGEIMGLDAGSVPAERLLTLIEPSDRERVVELVRTGLERHQPDDALFRVDHRVDGWETGTTRWVHGWGQPVENDDDSVRKIVGVLQDVTAEREALRLAEEREQRLQLVLDVTVTGVFDWDLRHQTITFSDNWYASIGYEPGELDTERWDWRRIVHPDDWHELSRHIGELLDGTVADLTHDVRVRCRDASWRWARLAAQAVARDDRGRAVRVIGAETDISRQRTMEQQLVHSAKMQSLGEFAGGIAHDFNNVMAIVRGHTELLLRSTAAETDAQRRLTAIERAVERASSLVRELMLLGRPATDNPVVVDLAEHIRTNSASWPTFLGDDVILDVDVPDDDAFAVRIDVSRLDAMFLNIVSNARDALPQGGHLRIALRRHIDRGRHVAQMTISDDGIGMDPTTLASMFEPFFTTKGPGVGTGLGLATSYTTVTQAGGTITAASEPGAGTTITIVLPLAEIGELTGPADTRVVEPRVSSGATILVVEDEAELLELNADVLRLAGYRVHAALGGHEALDILRDGTPIDLLLTDADMPDMSGPQLAATVREHWPHIGVLFLSGHAASTLATGSIDPTRLLTKPIAADRLVQAVADALDQIG